MSDVFKIAGDFTSHYEDESGKFFNPERNTWTAYPDSLASGLPTVGPGLTGTLGGQNIVAGQEYPANLIDDEYKIRSQEDYDLLSRNLGEQWGQYNPNQQASVMSLMHNVGSGNLLKSKAFGHLKEGNLEGFTHEAFDPEIGFVKAEQGGVAIPGLVRRRAAEKDLFNKSWNSTNTQPVDDLNQNFEDPVNKLFSDNEKVNSAFTTK